jgi:diacylglycerol kinase (ATP)
MTTTIAQLDETLRPGCECLVVANPAAASVTSDLVASVEAALRASPVLAAGASLRTRWTHAPGHARELAGSQHTADLVVAIGGDGTVSEVTQALAASGRDRLLCVVPAGSGNSTARSLWGDRTSEQVVALLAGDPPGRVRRRHLDLLRLHEPDLVSVLGASTGFLAQVLVDAEHVDPSLTGIDRYYAAAFAILADMPDHPTRVTVDGRVLSDGPTCSVAIGGGRFRARSFQFLPESVLDDGLLDVSSIGAVRGAAVDELAALIPTGEHLARPDVTYARGRVVVVERTDGLPLVAEFDGSVLTGIGSSLTAEVLPRAVSALAATDTMTGRHAVPAP